MRPKSKLIFDVICAVVLLIVLLPLIAIIAFLILVIDGRPIFYQARRMRSVQDEFILLKFRTMSFDPQDSGVSGGDKNSRITKMGRFLRGKRLDELPQLFNVLNGDISFVGPRPPLKKYVEKHPEIYEKVLQAIPGITGLASIYYHRHEELILSQCESAEETDTVYSRRCIPLKAKLDLIYLKNRSLCYDLKLMIKTAIR